jgi:carbon-monoxide dehydrogenase small subunit
VQHQKHISFKLNGERVRATVAPHHTLVEMLQRQFSLTGARESCGQGLCGCCTVIVNNRAVSGCLFLATNVDGAEVLTIEGLEVAERLSDVQRAFIDAGAFQCGYCTPGFILMTTKLLDEIPEPSVEQIKDYLTGNLCRCATYPEIIDAVMRVVQARNDRADR